MTRRRLGRTGFNLFPVGLGGMPLSIQGRPGDERALATLRAALDAGVDFIDTADAYCLDDGESGHNERLIRRAVEAAGRKDSVCVATKGGLLRPGGRWRRDASPRRLRSACEASLKALGVEAIPLYQLHFPDPRVPFEDSVGELARLKEEGKVLHVGLSNVDVPQLEAALRIVRVESVQNRCNPFEPGDYAGEMLKACERHGLSYLPYSTVGGNGGQARVGSQPVLQELGRKYAASPYAVTVAWHLSKGERVLPIPGASRPESIRDSASAASLRLDPEDLSRIDGIGG